MAYVSTNKVIEAELFEKGMEDGYYCVMKDMRCENCMPQDCGFKLPYVVNQDGTITVIDGTYYIIKHKDGTRTAVSQSVFESMYKPVEIQDIEVEQDG